MKLLELTDGLDLDNPKKEYVDASDISRIEAFTDYESVYETETKTTSGFLGIFGGSTKEVQVYKGEREFTGSKVFLKSGQKNHTYVKESPQTIVEMIKNKQFIVEV